MLKFAEFLVRIESYRAYLMKNQRLVMTTTSESSQINFFGLHRKLLYTGSKRECHLLWLNSIRFTNDWIEYAVSSFCNNRRGGETVTATVHSTLFYYYCHFLFFFLLMFTFLATDSLVNPKPQTSPLYTLSRRKCKKEEKQIHLPRKTRTEKRGRHKTNEEKKKRTKSENLAERFQCQGQQLKYIENWAIILF